MLHKKKEEYEQQMLRNEELAGQNVQQLSELNKKEEDIARLKQEIAKVNRLRDGLQRKLRGVEEQKAEMEAQRDATKQQIASLEKGKCVLIVKLYEVHFVFLDMEQQRKQTEADKKATEDLVRERDMLSKVRVEPFILLLLTTFVGTEKVRRINR